MDGDGALDVVVANISNVDWFRNDGSGTFSEQAVGPALSTAIFAADLNADGGPDVLSTTDFVSTLSDDEIVWFRKNLCPTSLPASAVVRLGTPPNPAALLNDPAGGPVVCRTWRPRVDHSSFQPAAIAEYLAVSKNAINVPTAFGTLLCTLPPPSLTFFKLAPAIGLPFQIPVPGDCALVGSTACVQAASVDSTGTIALTNALDVTIGTF